MFAAIYSFNIKSGHKEDFLKAWRELTLLIHTYEGSLGSRLHHEGDGIYIAYAQWPNRETYVNSGDNLPEEAMKWRELMRRSCNSIKTLHELDMVDDLLKKETKKKADR